MQNGKFGVDALARQAVRFLHLCFESDHPRVRGQTVSEVSNKTGQFCIQAKWLIKLELTLVSVATMKRLGVF